MEKPDEICTKTKMNGKKKFPEENCSDSTVFEWIVLRVREKSIALKVNVTDSFD